MAKRRAHDFDLPTSPRVIGSGLSFVGSAAERGARAVPVQFMGNGVLFGRVLFVQRGYGIWSLLVRLGAGTFGLLICALPTRYFSTISFLALSADVPLLLWQVIYGPCGKCLLVAGVLVANALVITWGGFPVRRSCKIALRVAAALLCINLSALVGNAVRPWLTEQISTTPALKELRIFLPPSRPLLFQDQFTGSSGR